MIQVLNKIVLFIVEKFLFEFQLLANVIIIITLLWVEVGTFIKLIKILGNTKDVLLFANINILFKLANYELGHFINIFYK